MSQNVFEKIKSGLLKTRQSISGKLGGVLAAFKKIDEDFYEELEESLILCDIGLGAAESIMTALKQQVKEQKIIETAQVKPLLVSIIARYSQHSRQAA